MSGKEPRKGFHDLPPEIHNQIYRYCSPSVAALTLIDGEISILERVGTDVWYTVKSLPILHLDRNTRAEATAFLYNRCTFAVTIRLRQLRYDAFYGQLARWSLSLEPLRIKPIPYIRNWLIDLQWDTQQYGDGQPFELEKALYDIVKILRCNRSPVNITIMYPCNCCFLWGGFMVLDTDALGHECTRMPTDTEGHRAVFKMLEPLVDLYVVNKVDLVPTVFVKTRFPPYLQYLCEKDECHRLTRPLGEIMTAKGRDLYGSREGFGHHGKTVDSLSSVRAELGIAYVQKPGAFWGHREAKAFRGEHERSFPID